jgi:hypothetical protein
MKKIVASVGLVALASSIGAVRGELPAPSPEKPWNVSAALRGFYDDNINTTTTKESSTGFQINPAVGVHWGNGQTMVQAGYVYTYRYYGTKPANNTQYYDQDHEFDALFNHAFNERYQLSMKESFVIGQEPELLRASTIFGEFQRVSGNNIRNYGTLVFDATLTPTFGLEVGYGNEYFNYDDSGPGSYSATLDRIVNQPYLEGHWQVAPQTVGVVGVQYQGVNYTGDEIIGIIPPFTPVYSDSRNSRASTGYLGVNHNFTPECSILANLGATYIDYYNDNSSRVNPYAKVNLQYTYTVESYAQLGLTYYNAPTDIVAASPTEGITRGVNAFVLYGSINHRIVPDLFGSLTAQFQNSVFQGGGYNNESEQFYLVGLNLRYKFNHYLSADAGYNYDNLTSPVPNRTFNRNRLYFGVTGTY